MGGDDGQAQAQGGRLVPEPTAPERSLRADFEAQGPTLIEAAM